MAIRNYVLNPTEGRPFVRLSVTKFLNAIFWKCLNRFWCKLAQLVHETRAGNGQLWGQEVKGQGHTRPRIDLEAWGDIILD